jgi:hypothetical protein
LARWKNPFSQLFNVHGISDVKQTEIHTAEPLVPKPSAFELQIIIKLKRHELPCVDKIPAELIKVRGRTICSEIHKLINSVWNKEALPEKWKESIIVPIYKKGDTTDCCNCRGISLLSVDKLHILCMTEALVVVSQETGQEINAAKIKYLVMPGDQIIG